MPSSPPLCDRCCEPILVLEEAIPTASRRLFHPNCFTCSKRQCGCTLSVNEHGVYQNQIFCPKCFVSFLIFQNGNPFPSNGENKSNGGQECQQQQHKELVAFANANANRIRAYEHQLRTLQLNDDAEDDGGILEKEKNEKDGEGEDDDDSMQDDEEEEEEQEEGMMLTVVPRLTMLQSLKRAPFGPSPIPEETEEMSNSESQTSPNSLVMRTTDGRKQKSDNGDTNRVGICAIQRTARTWTCPSRNGNANGGIVVSAAAICPVGNGGVIPLRSSNCKRCSGRVYEAEKVVAASEVWHKGCFRCLRCGRSLEPGKFSDRAGEIYCNSCYAREFGPKGVGCGLGAGILQMHQ